RVFTGNMTGNIVILGMGLAGADGLPIVGPAVALFAFVGGVIIAGAALRGARSGWTPRATILLGLVAAFLVAALVPALVNDAGTLLPMLVATALLGLAMGVQAGVARHIAVADVTTVVVTSTLVSLAYESYLGKSVPQRWARRALAIVILIAGAAVGALLLRLGLAWGIGAAAALTAGVALVGAVSRHPPARSPKGSDGAVTR
ncbi:MAG TPA: YoaK family protein, partial [Microbacterium sp.]|uniref:YoaK family protein n=1 Tax=Microbacterium sp. TaxID=51671 RepID=UPI002C089C2B